MGTKKGKRKKGSNAKKGKITRKKRKRKKKKKKATTNAKQPAQVKCAEQNGKCKCTGKVYYGKKYVRAKSGHVSKTNFEKLKALPHQEKDVDGEVKCDIKPMGGDPSPGQFKWCFCEN